MTESASRTSAYHFPLQIMQNQNSITNTNRIMENQVFKASAGMMGKSIILKENELWVHTDEVKSLEKFEKDILKTGMKQSAYKIEMSAINEISYNEASESTKVKYTNEKGKEKKLNITFEDVDLSNQFGQYLGSKLGFKQSSIQEGQIKPLLLNGLYLLIALGMTFFVGTMEDTSMITDSKSRRGSGNRAIFKLIVDTVGQTGVFLIGGLISLYLAYQLFRRFKNPSNEILYTN